MWRRTNSGGTVSMPRTATAVSTSHRQNRSPAPPVISSEWVKGQEALQAAGCSGSPFSHSWVVWSGWNHVSPSCLSFNMHEMGTRTAPTPRSSCRDWRGDMCSVVRMAGSCNIERAYMSISYYCYSYCYRHYYSVCYVLHSYCVSISYEEHLCIYMCVCALCVTNRMWWAWPPLTLQFSWDQTVWYLAQPHRSFEAQQK